jgi:hypothetical protein
MDATSVLKRIILIAVLSALPTFVGVASAHGGGGSSSGGSSSGSSSSGSSGGHSSSGSNGGSSSSGSNSGHSSSGSNSGHSSNGSNGGHFPSGSNGGHSSHGSGVHSTGVETDPSGTNSAVATGRSVGESHVKPNTVQMPTNTNRRFQSGGGNLGDVTWGEDENWRRRHHRLLFGFLRY